MTRVGLVLVLLGALAAGIVWYLLDSRAADDSAAPIATAPARDHPPATPPPAARTTDPAPRPSETAPAATARRRPAPSVAAPTAEPAPAAPETGTLRVTSDVPGAQVFVNREFVGTSPATKSGLAPGSYQLNVSAPGYDNHVETIEVTPGEHDVNVRFREIRLNASVDVVHKHRFGSCKGRLTATARGVRYETSHKEDAFEAPLANLETFTVDYLDKNLRIQLRRGKRYDFTDPEGNADRLFVFHRDVERARERLQKGDTP